MTPLPRDPTFDATIGVLRDGYEYVWKHCRRLDSDAFTTRVMLHPAVCVHGVEAARLFYDESKMERHHALPRRVVTSLFGKKAVHTLDDEAHRVRKAAFLFLMSPTNLERLAHLAADRWRWAIRRWERQPTVVVFDETAQVLTAAVCAWAGVPLAPEDVASRARDLVALVDAFGGVGPRLWRGKRARHRTESWIRALVGATRRGAIAAAPNEALAVMAHHRDLGGALLDEHTAAVEVINVLRPTVAITWFVAFSALALARHPVMRARIATERRDGTAGAFADDFMQEVRRFYPFTPYLGAMVRAPFEWRGHAFAPGTLVILDVYGMLHDPALWERPDDFRPERFADRGADAFCFIPQGGGSLDQGHRCPGEWIVMHQTTLALHFLTRAMTWELAPHQDLRVSLRRMPTRPASGVVLRDVRATIELDAETPVQPSLTAARESAGALGRGELRSA
jgi:fatty-acid peroxygenase